MTAQDIKKGVIIIYNGEPWQAVDVSRSKVAQREAMVRTKLKNLKTGKTVELTYRSEDTVAEADVAKKSLQFLYKTGSQYCFMDEGYEQYEVSAGSLGDKEQYLTEGVSVEGVFWNEGLYDIIFPKKMVFKVTFAPPGVRGDSAGSVTKQIEIETGAKLNAPLFIDEGDKIRINTET
ncbi:MAG: elongation factor P, partial [Parcubacteria group bacterium]|nr:elongation factor P [Parcubacteria group bacterium]